MVLVKTAKSTREQTLTGINVYTLSVIEQCRYSSKMEPAKLVIHLQGLTNQGIVAFPINVRLTRKLLRMVSAKNASLTQSLLIG